MKRRLITLEIEWNPATTYNPERWDWYTLVDADGTDINVKLVEASPNEDFQREFDNE